jgi:hypothetical protein
LLKFASGAVVGGAIVTAALWGDTGSLWPLDCENATWRPRQPRRREHMDWSLGRTERQEWHDVQRIIRSEPPECLLCDG